MSVYLDESADESDEEEPEDNEEVDSKDYVSVHLWLCIYGFVDSQYQQSIVSFCEFDDHHKSSHTLRRSVWECSVH